MSRVRLLYFLFSKRKKPLYVHDVDGNGNGPILEGDGNYKKIGGQPAHLTHDPEGWKETLVKYGRNIKYWGVFRSFTVPMKFVRDGAKIIKDGFVAQGIEAIMYLGIAKLDELTLPYNYKSWYLSEINFVKYKENRHGVTIEAMEGGLSKYLKAYENQKYEIPIDTDPECVSVEMDGMELENSAQWFVSEGFSATPFYNRGSHVVATDIIQKEIGDIGGVFSTVRTKVGNINNDIHNTGQYIFNATTDGTIKIDYNFKLTVTYYTSEAGINPGTVLGVVFRRINQSGVSLGQQIILQRSATPFGAAGINGTYNLQGSFNLAMLAGEELYLYTFMNNEGVGGATNTEFSYGGDEPFIKMSYTYKHPKSVVLGHTAIRLMQLLVDKMTGSTGGYIAKSAYLNSKINNLVITSGDALRGIHPSFLTTSFEEFRKAMNREGIGIGIEGENLVLEQLPYFFQNTVIHKCGVVKDITYYPAEDLLFNSIYVGYKEQEYKEINGRMEFNQGQRWKTPVTRITKELDLTSPYRADPFGIELLRINFGDKKTTDSKSDNETFMLDVRPQFNSFTTRIQFTNFYNLMLMYGQAGIASSFKFGTRFRITGTLYNNQTFMSAGNAGSNNGVDLIVGAVAATAGGINLVVEDAPAANVEILTYILNRPAYTSVTGLLHPDTAFNIELSPKRSLLANAAYIRSCLDRMDGGKLELTSADRNKDLTTVLAGVTISENESLDIVNLPARLFRPYYIEYVTESPINLLEIMAVNPYGLIEFEQEDGELFYGFLMDGGLKPSTLDTQQWKLLCAPQNDLKKLLKK